MLDLNCWRSRNVESSKIKEIMDKYYVEKCNINDAAKRLILAKIGRIINSLVNLLFNKIYFWNETILGLQF